MKEGMNEWMNKCTYNSRKQKRIRWKSTDRRTDRKTDRHKHSHTSVRETQGTIERRATHQTQPNRTQPNPNRTKLQPNPRAQASVIPTYKPHPHERTRQAHQASLSHHLGRVVGASDGPDNPTPHIQRQVLLLGRMVG